MYASKHLFAAFATCFRLNSGEACALKFLHNCNKKCNMSYFNRYPLLIKNFVMIWHDIINDRRQGRAKMLNAVKLRYGSMFSFGAEFDFLWS